MFDPCRAWRKLMELLTEGTLSPEQRAELQAHLRGCSECLSLFETDALRRDLLSQHEGRLTASEAHSFDDEVVAALRVSAEPEPLTLRGGWRCLLRNLPTDFLQQLAGGALAASAVTIICLFSALHPRITGTRQETLAPQASRSEPPVALESLLRAHSPRAYSLWSVPGTPRAPRPAPAVHRLRSKNTGKQGATVFASRLS